MFLAYTAVSPVVAFLVIGAFFVVWIAVGALLKRFVLTEEDELLAGRNVGNALGILTVMAAWTTTGTILGTSEFGYTIGILGIFAIVLGGGAAMLFFALLAPRIQRLMPTGRTVGDFFRLRYDAKNYYLFLAATLVWDIGFMVSLGLGAGIVLETLFGIPYIVGVIATTAVCIVYVALAQMVSVIANDWVQGMLIMLLMVVVMTIVYANTGIGSIYQAVASSKQSGLLSLTNGAGYLSIAGIGIYGVSSVFIDNLWWSRAWAIRNVLKVFTVAGLGWMTIALLSGLTAYIVIFRGIPITQPDQVFPKTVQEFLPGAGAIIGLMIMYAAIASTFAAILWAAASLILVDVYKQFVNPNASQAQRQWMGAAIVIGLGVVVTLASIPKPLTVQTLLTLFGVVTGAYTFPVVMGLYWSRTSRLGAFVGVIVGIVVGFYLYFGVSQGLLFQSVIVSSALSSAIVLLFTLVRPETFSWARLRTVEFEGENVPRAVSAAPVTTMGGAE
jgi:Na+/proline symporter